MLEVKSRPAEILLIEDNPGDARLLRFAFDQIRCACNIQVATTGVEALERLFRDSGADTYCPDLILLDLNLPVISGHELLERIKSDPATRTIPVIVLSSSEAPRDISHAYQLYANSYVTKPQDLDDLLRLASVLEEFWLRTARLPSLCSLDQQLICNELQRG